MKKPLLLNGKPFVANSMRPILPKIAEYFDKAPENEVFDKTELIRLRLACKSSLDSFMREKCFQKYFFKHGQHPLFGNPKAIVALKAEIGE